MYVQTSACKYMATYVYTGLCVYFVADVHVYTMCVCVDFLYIRRYMYTVYVYIYISYRELVQRSLQESCQETS